MLLHRAARLTWAGLGWLSRWVEDHDSQDGQAPYLCYHSVFLTILPFSRGPDIRKPLHVACDGLTGIRSIDTQVRLARRAYS